MRNKNKSKTKDKTMKSTNKKIKTKTKKATKFSLVVAILLLISSLFFTSIILITLFNKPIFLAGYSAIISNYLSYHISFVKGSIFYLLPTFISMFIISIMIFSYRGRKPYSYIKILIFMLFVFSFYLFICKALSRPFPGILRASLLNDSLTSVQISFRILFFVIVQGVLLIIFNPICDHLNDRYNKKPTRIKKKTNKSLEKKQPNKVQTPEIPKATRKLKKSELGMEFPKPIDIPTLSFIEKQSINKDVGVIKTPMNVEKYQAKDQEIKKEIEDDFISNLNPKQTISLETLRLAKKNVEEKMNKLNNPEQIRKTPLKSSNNNEAISFESILQQNLESNKAAIDPDLNNEPRAESAAVRDYKAQEALDVKNKVSSIYNSKIRKNSAVQKKKNEDYLHNPLKNIMNGGYLAKATEKNSIKENIEEVVEKPESKRQSTSSIVDEINRNLSSQKSENHGDDFSDVNFSDVDLDIKQAETTSSTLASNGGNQQYDTPLAENSYATANYNSTAKAVGNGELVDEKEELIKTVEEDEDLESAVAGLISSNIVDNNKYSYKFPPQALLREYPQSTQFVDEDAKLQAQILVETLAQFKYEVELRNIIKGPTVTMFEIIPAPGIKINAITNLRDNIAMNLAAKKVRILAPIPGQTAVGVEIPNSKRDKVGFKEVLTSSSTLDMALPMTMGKTLYGDCIVFDLASSPHMLIAGSTGSGKSVCINSLICSILYTRSPRDVRLIMVDPKVVELTLYNGIPHLLTPVITEPKRALKALDFCIDEMDRRNKMLSKMSVRNIKGYNKKIKELHIAQQKMPYIIVIIDEFASLMSTAGKDLDERVARLTSMSRAVGIHLVFATQRPSVDVITGVIKNNLPTRVAFAVTSIQDSRTIIGSTGAENLLGKGDMLFSANGRAVTRLQGVFLSDEEVEDIVDFAKRQEEPDYIDESYFEDPYDEESSDETNDYEDDELWDEALKICFERGSVSASFLQRRLKIGYNRAATLVEGMEEKGIVGPINGSKPRELLRY